MGYLLIILGGYIAAMNWLAPIIAYRSGQSVSMVPPVGAVLLGLGIFNLTRSMMWALLAIPLDLGAVLFLVSLPTFVTAFWQTSSVNQIQRLKCRNEGRDYLIILYRNGSAAIRQDYHHTLPPRDDGSVPAGRGYNATWEHSIAGYIISVINDGRQIKLDAEDDIFVAQESNVPEDTEWYCRMNTFRFTPSARKNE